jgi:hypothetical protein
VFEACQDDIALRIGDADIGRQIVMELRILGPAYEIEMFRVPLIIAPQRQKHVVALQNDPLNIFFEDQCQIAALTHGFVVGAAMFLLAQEIDAGPDNRDYGETQIGRRL